MENNITEGTVLHWTSQAQGYSKKKIGKVVAVVPAGERPNRDDWPQLYKGPGVGGSRDHESYVVRADGKIYWPRVSTLRTKT